jgi:hypothetical protein
LYGFDFLEIKSIQNNKINDKTARRYVSPLISGGHHPQQWAQQFFYQTLPVTSDRSLPV